MILVTGSDGLIGTALCAALRARGHEVRGFDVRGPEGERGDVNDARQLSRAARGCSGVVHLAALSRVIWGEQRPVECVETNVGGTRNAVEAAADTGAWLVQASSREVYGHPATETAVAEDFPLVPCNVYGHSKVAGEHVVTGSGRSATIVRFSNVYGSALDHADRVVPAFVRAAMRGEDLRVDGSRHVFDFTYVHDVVEALVKLVGRMEAGEPTPKLHFVSGTGVTLGELAETVIGVVGRDYGTVSGWREGPPRSYDVARFVGDPTRAERVLGWQHKTGLRDGVRALAADFRRRGIA